MAENYIDMSGKITMTEARKYLKSEEYAQCDDFRKEEFKEKLQRAENSVSYRQRNILSVLAKSGACPRHLNANKDDFSTDLWDKVWSNWQTGEGLFITGDTGVGKTHMAIAMAREHILTELPIIDLRLSAGMPFIDPQHPIIITVPDLLMGIKDRMIKKWDSEYTMKHADAKYLFLDDLGAEKITDWVLERLFVIIDHRYRNKKQTLITSNLSLNQISDNGATRIASRIQEMCHCIELHGKDRRSALRKGNSEEPVEQAENKS